MSKIVPMDLVRDLRGKVCMHSDFYFQKRNGSIFTGRKCAPRDLNVRPYTEAELARQAKFSATRAAMKRLTDAQKQAYNTEFLNQSKYKTLQGYVFAEEYKKAA